MNFVAPTRNPDTSGRYRDYDPVTGTPGSVPPAAIFNALLDEVLAVIVAGGLTPSSGSMTQLRDAIQTLVAGNPGGLPQATETVLGGGEVATAAEVTTGTSDTTLITPKKLRDYLSALGLLGGGGGGGGSLLAMASISSAMAVTLSRGISGATSVSLANGVYISQYQSVDTFRRLITLPFTAPRGSVDYAVMLTPMIGQGMHMIVDDAAGAQETFGARHLIAKFADRVEITCEAFSASWPAFDVVVTT